MDRKKLFDEIRANPTLFGKSLKTEHVLGTEAIIDAAIKHRVSDPHHVAHILAHVYHETGTYMLPVKETVYASHKNKNPSDAEVIRRLDAALKKGQLGKVSTPYWKDGWFGRGQIQITHEDNYRKLGTAIGVDLVADRNKALDPKIGAEIAVVGMSRGLFRGKKLSDYTFPASLDFKQENHPRRIVNGNDGTDKDIAKYHRAFYDALVKAGYGDEPAPPVAIPTQPLPSTPAPTPQRTRGVILAEMQALLDELKTLGG